MYGFDIYFVYVDMIQNQALLYSASEDLTISQIKRGIYDPNTDVSKVQNWMTKHDIDALVEGSDHSHYKFLGIKSKPYIIYYQGDISLLNKQLIAIVGPREPTIYGQKILKSLFEHLKEYDLVTISGMAPGIDQCAHQLSQEYDIPTIAVLGGGLGYYLGSHHRSLIEKIVNKGGLILSEFKLSQRPETYTFPQRNRIIAGLSDMVFLPEAGKKSGSLITVEFAEQMGKPIYGTANDLFSPQSAGLHDLMSKGKIRMVSDIETMLSTHFSKKLDDAGYKTPKLQQLLPQEQQIVEWLIQQQEGDIQKCILDLHIEHNEVLKSLTRLEIENIVYQSCPGIFHLQSNIK